MSYYIGQIFEGMYPVEASDWCNETGNTIVEITQDPKVYKIIEVSKPTPEEQEEIFNREFFYTSLGYVRRSVTMKNGEVKDFLADILPVLEIGVPILTYTKNLIQSKVFVTAEFLTECKQQVLKDFYGV